MSHTWAAHTQGVFVDHHSVHLAMVLGPLVVLGLMLLGLHLSDPDRRQGDRRNGTGPIAGLTLLAAAIHLSVMPSHFHEAAIIGLFFATSAAIQIVCAAAILLRPSTRVLMICAAGNFSFAMLWCYSRIVAVPFGLGAREAVGLIDLVCTIAELVSVAIALAMVYRRMPTGQLAAA